MKGCLQAPGLPHYLRDFQTQDQRNQVAGRCSARLHLEAMAGGMAPRPVELRSDFSFTCLMGLFPTTADGPLLPAGQSGETNSWQAGAIIHHFSGAEIRFGTCANGQAPASGQSMGADWINTAAAGLLGCRNRSGGQRRGFKRNYRGGSFTAPVISVTPKPDQPEPHWPGFRSNLELPQYSQHLNSSHGAYYGSQTPGRGAVISSSMLNLY